MSENEKNDSMPEITGHLDLGGLDVEEARARMRASLIGVDLTLGNLEKCRTDSWSAFASPESFRESGLLKQVNALLRPYGWGIAFVMGEDGTVASVQPVTIPVVLETELAALAEEDQERVARLERLTVPD